MTTIATVGEGGEGGQKNPHTSEHEKNRKINDDSGMSRRWNESMGDR